MRVSTAFQYDGYASAIRSTTDRLQAAQERVTSGKRIEKPSDDASGTRQLLGIGQLRNGIAGYTKNLDVAKGVLGTSEQAYSDLGDLVQSAQTLAIQGATSAVDPAARDEIADQIQSLQDRLVSLGNTQAPDGRYVFGGQVTDAKPFSVAADGTLTYAGNTTMPTMETGPGASTKVGETGGNVATLYANLQKLQASLRSGDTNTISNVRLAELKDSGDALSSAQADVGRRMDSIEATRTTLAQQDTDLTARASDIGDVDYATAIVDYTAAQSAYQGALQVATKGFSLSLMDFMTS